MGTPVALDLLEIKGFEHIRITHDPVFKKDMAMVHPGDYYLTLKDELMHTNLGSCVAVTMRDPKANVAGMNHFMLPGRFVPGRNDVWERSKNFQVTRYGVDAMESLLGGVLAQGGRRERLEIKVFGGGDMRTGSRGLGRKNVELAFQFLHSHRLRVQKYDVGGIAARVLMFFARSGKVKMKRIVAKKVKK